MDGVFSKIMPSMVQETTKKQFYVDTDVEVL